MQSRPSPLSPNLSSQRDVTSFRRDWPIGQLLCHANKLRPPDVEQVLRHQQQHGGRFGEIAIGMGLATEEDVLEVLARQFDYPYARRSEGTAISPELVCAHDPLGEDAQGFRDLRTELLAGVLDRSTPRALAVLSPQQGDGRSYVAANLAIALAQLGQRTLLVDADLRSPRQHALFGIDDSVGLSQLLCGRVGPEVAQQATGFPRLFLIGAGPVPPNPVELLQRGVLLKLVKEWLAKFDHVVIDTPAIRHGTEARLIADAAGAALVVARPHESRMADLERLVTGIEKGHAALAGVVVNEH